MCEIWLKKVTVVVNILAKQQRRSFLWDTLYIWFKRHFTIARHYVCMHHHGFYGRDVASLKLTEGNELWAGRHRVMWSPSAEGGRNEAPRGVGYPLPTLGVGVGRGYPSPPVA